MMQPLCGADEFLGQTEIDEIAGHGDVVGLLLDDIAGDEIEDLAPMHKFAPAMPIDVAEHALAQQLAALGLRHRAQMNVGQMGEGEHGAQLPGFRPFSTVRLGQSIQRSILQALSIERLGPVVCPLTEY